MKWTTEAQKWAEESRVGEAERAEAERLAAARGKDEVGLREAQAAVGKREMAAGERKRPRPEPTYTNITLL